MEWFLANGATTVGLDRYDCSIRAQYPNISYLKGTPERYVGAGFIMYGILTETIYIIVLMVIMRPELMRLSCYKIMFVLGLYDMMAIGVNSLLTGYLFLFGATYCSNPDLIYITGAIGLGLWCGACMICFILVINRLIDLWNPQLMEPVFAGNRTYIVLLFPISYSIYFALFTEPLLFNSDMTAWFFDGFILNPTESEMIHNYPHTANNLLIVVSTCVLYALLCIVFIKKFKSKEGGNKITWNQKSFFVGSAGLTCYEPFADWVTISELVRKKPHDIVLFEVTPHKVLIQSSAICLANLIAALVYVYMQFFYTPKWLILIGHMCWQAGHGIPAFVYLLMNRTIQSEVLKMLGLKKKTARLSTSVNPSATHTTHQHI